MIGRTVLLLLFTVVSKLCKWTHMALICCCWWGSGKINSKETPLIKFSGSGKEKSLLWLWANLNSALHYASVKRCCAVLPDKSFIWNEVFHLFVIKIGRNAGGRQVQQINWTSVFFCWFEWNKQCCLVALYLLESKILHKSKEAKRSK